MTTGEGVFSALIGQPSVVETLHQAVVDAASQPPGPGMTHAWLFTGPPGSGRSTAAVCFASALACSAGGCGTCSICRQVPSGAHPDVEVVRPEGLSYSVHEARALVQRAALAPMSSPWHVVVLEDADRLTEEAANVLLKTLEEPSPRTVWLLCAPSVEDVLPTVRSRTRHVGLRTPSAAEVAEALVNRDGVDGAMAAFAARASQGHIGRARALAKDEHARIRRQEVLRIPLELRDLPSCFVNAANLLEAATEDADAVTQPRESAEADAVRAEYGSASGEAPLRGAIRRSMDAALKDLQRRQRTRATRMVRDQVDRALVDLLGLYRDVLFTQFDVPLGLINEEMRPQITKLAGASTSVDTARRMLAITHTRAQLAANVAPITALEALMVQLKDPLVAAAA
ncbi:MAG: DNA polymerase III subunit delta' [Actinomycetales bacterium]|nr:DNA polymerase III subunit delta' [Actinomycetales bacterium]